MGVTVQTQVSSLSNHQSVFPAAVLINNGGRLSPVVSVYVVAAGLEREAELARVDVF